jgi:hypothetical protein
MTHPALIILFSGAMLVAQATAKPGKAPAEAPPPTAGAEDVASNRATPYKPTIQRDPFAAPREERNAEGLDVLDDIAVKGMIRKDGKNFAVVSDSRGNVRWLPVGHRFKDGEITSITDKEVIFHQWEVNTTNRSTFRTITKTFKREEGKR